MATDSRDFMSILKAVILTKGHSISPVSILINQTYNVITNILLY